MISLVELCCMHESSVVMLTQPATLTLHLYNEAVEHSPGPISRDVAIEIACLDPNGPQKLERL